jgi:hypothetical protein
MGLAWLLRSAWLAQIGLIGSPLYGRVMIIGTHFDLLSKQGALCFRKNDVTQR